MPSNLKWPSNLHPPRSTILSKLVFPIDNPPPGLYRKITSCLARGGTDRTTHHTKFGISQQYLPASRRTPWIQWERSVLSVDRLAPGRGRVLVNVGCCRQGSASLARHALGWFEERCVPIEQFIMSYRFYTCSLLLGLSLSFADSLLQ